MSGIWENQPRSKAGGLAVISSGRGRRVVLLHGVGLRAEAWAAVANALSPEFHLIAPDMPGHGESAPDSAISSLRHYSDAVLPLLSEPTAVIGHSMGAMIALDLATRYPQKITSVAALNAVFVRTADARNAVLDRAAVLDGVSTADPQLTLSRWFGASPSPEREACTNWLTSVDPGGYKAAYTVFASENGPSTEALKSLTCPALFMTGANEPNSTPTMSRRMAALAPHGQASIVPDAAHMMPMTHAGAVAQKLSAFLRETVE